ncbi:MAG: GntR family transcriptional regulator, partial [Arthrobacter sp.]|nr:GntR family transcriptional regulator [Arthrobacter sp.]
MSSDAVLAGLRREARAAHAHTAQWVAATLRQRIADGELTPGTKLPEEALREAQGHGGLRGDEGAPGRRGDHRGAEAEGPLFDGASTHVKAPVAQ